MELQFIKRFLQVAIIKSGYYKANKENANGETVPQRWFCK